MPLEYSSARSVRRIFFCAGGVSALLLALWIWSRPPASWITVGQNKSAIIETEPAIYQAADAGKTPRFYLRLRITNRASHPLGVCLRGLQSERWRLSELMIFDGNSRPPMNGMKQIALGLKEWLNKPRRPKEQMDVLPPGTTRDYFAPSQKGELDAAIRNWKQRSLLVRAKSLLPGFRYAPRLIVGVSGSLFDVQLGQAPKPNYFHSDVAIPFPVREKTLPANARLIAPQDAP